ncbi:glycosyltransferase family 39 protein [Paenibacillus oenotherae]|uniref:Glycosyltransferase family 39 protein n=1 Tax=Paenibacillus oenotherae TaxID=1435645 RepID=A0ABS7D5I2_9BACL|nr:glycosyltransferase family 39 protein [Paenibacillus oenotherae]MBW7475104.1 glycosyltransferase family 39 protein [Paenibacillus oenotherae]
MRKWKGRLQPAILLLIVIVALAAWLRIDFVASVSHHVSHDTIHYDAMIRQWLESGIYAYKDTEPNAQVTPGYPLFMAAVYRLVDYTQHDPFLYIRYIQVLMGTAMVVFVYLIARRLSGPWTGLIAAATAAVYPSFIWATGAILTETQAALLFTLYLYLQLIVFDGKKARYALLAGGAMGLTVLTRPEFLVLMGASYLFYWLWSRETARTAKLLLFTILGTAIVLSPWVIRNMVTLHKVVVASTQVNPFAAGTYPDKNYEDGLVDRHGKTQMEVAVERLKVGFSTKPWEFTKWYTVGKLKYIYAKMFYGSGHQPYYPVIPYGRWLHMGIVGMGIISCLALIRSWRQPAALVVVLLIVLSVTRLAFVPEYRYNFTAMPLLIIIDSLVGMMMLSRLAAAYRMKWRNYLPGGRRNEQRDFDHHTGL